MTISLTLIATRLYKSFVSQLLDGVEKYFLPNHEVEVVLFTDEENHFDNLKKDYQQRVKLKTVLIPAYEWPFATLYRYKIITENRKEITGGHVFYSDVDMKFISKVGGEILNPLTSVYHPGFFRREKYYAGGFQGGARLNYLIACKIMADQIAKDQARGWKPEHNDEWYWNEYLKTADFTELDQGYCMVEEPHLRKSWGIDHFEPKILALSKDHLKMRS
jgi:hypothetical protein